MARRRHDEQDRQSREPQWLKGELGDTVPSWIRGQDADERIAIAESMKLDGREPAMRECHEEGQDAQMEFAV